MSDSKKTKLNVVEAMADDDEEQAFDQPCKFENRVGGHGTYCHNEKMVGQRKCPYRFTSAASHSKCEGFEANPNDKSDWKDIPEAVPAASPWRRISSIEVKD